MRIHPTHAGIHILEFLLCQQTECPIYTLYLNAGGERYESD